jgi:hypothetical protein
MISRFPVLPIGAAAAALLLASASFGGDDENDNDLRTADQAKAMLAQAVAAVKADKAKALDMFNKGEGGFRDGNLYVSCTNVSDGKFVATGNPNSKNLLGVDGKTFKDINGDTMPLEAIAQKPEGEITIFDIQLPKPGTNKKAWDPIEIYATKVEGLICGVGWYYYRSVED